VAKAGGPITNQVLGKLLTHLGFESSEKTEKSHRAWRHAGAGTVIFLPSNKTGEAPLPRDLLSVRTHLDANGHLEGQTFDEFVKTGDLRSIS
jgi:hypothetical protein